MPGGKLNALRKYAPLISTCVLVYLIVYSSFLLGSYSVSFSGSRSAWVALIESIVVIAVGVVDPRVQDGGSHLPVPAAVAA